MKGIYAEQTFYYKINSDDSEYVLVSFAFNDLRECFSISIEQKTPGM
jgi:hypothetical protein